MAKNDTKVEKFRVGVVLDMDVPEVKVCWTSMKMALSDLNASRKRKLVFYHRNSKEDILDASSAAIYLIKKYKVQAIIGPTTSAQTVYMMQLGKRSMVPIISFSATSPSISPSQNPYFIGTTLNDSSQVNAIAAIIKAFGWREVVPLYPNTEYGKGIIPYLVDAFQKISTRVPYRSVFPSSATDEEIGDELHRLATMQTRVFILHVTAPLGVRIFAKAKEIGMMSSGYSWIITDGLGDYLSTFNSSVFDSMEGVIGIRPYVPESPKLKSFRVRWQDMFRKENPHLDSKLDMFGVWAYDTVWALGNAVEKLKSLNPEFNKPKAALNSSESSDVEKMGVSQIGSELLREISNIKLKGPMSGTFNIIEGQLQYDIFEIVNVIGNGPRPVGIWTPLDGIVRNISFVGINKSTITDKYNLGPIIWPGDTYAVPKGWQIPTMEPKLKIGVPLKKKGFTEFLEVTENTQNSSSVTGCSTKVFDEAVNSLDYSLPYEYFPFQINNKDAPGSYNDLVDAVSNQIFDAAVGDITITFGRSQCVDFTLPYNEGGVSMIVLAKQDMSKTTWIFLKPLEWKLWVTTGAFFLIIGFAIWILEHRVNREFRGGPHSAYQLGTILSFSFSTLVFAQKERVLSSLGRIFLGIWLFVVLILTQSYTANLASMLTIKRLDPTYTDVKELIRYGYNVGYQEGSFVLDQLKGLGFDESNLKTYNTPEEFDELFSKGLVEDGIVAAFEELPYIELILAKYCDKYMMVGEIYQNEGWSFVFPKGSPLGPDISRQILKLRENGATKRIKQGFIRSTSKITCQENNTLGSSTSLKLESFWVLFRITGGSVLFAILVFLVMFLWENVQILADSNTTVLQKFVNLLNEFNKYDEKRLITYFEYQHVRNDQNKDFISALDSDTNDLGEAACGSLPNEGVAGNEGQCTKVADQDLGLLPNENHATDYDNTSEEVDSLLDNIVEVKDQTQGGANLHCNQSSECRNRRPLNSEALVLKV
ncbi:hypothetical protein MKW94_018083 [Papaver nudicaule]|uniref:Glutamate receptor n=1 Tax=Papaver nudicaule TaxID=74823 RepID=A0AA41VL85_PAPNU|nr:hypothetical protein [Papaver nudicaule]